MRAPLQALLHEITDARVDPCMDEEKCQKAKNKQKIHINQKMFKLGINVTILRKNTIFDQNKMKLH